MNLKELAEKFKDYVTIERYKPVENLVYGFVKIILGAVALAIIGLVIIK